MCVWCVVCVCVCVCVLKHSKLVSLVSFRQWSDLFDSSDMKMYVKNWIELFLMEL